jgi:hypothetical protein
MGYQNGMMPKPIAKREKQSATIGISTGHRGMVTRLPHIKWENEDGR